MVSSRVKAVWVDCGVMMVRVGRRNSLEALEEQVADEIVKKRRKRKRYNTSDRTRIAANVRKGTRKPPPVPKNKSLAEIKEMDPQHIELRHKDGRPRVYAKVGTENEYIKPVEEMSFSELVKADKQKRANGRRGKVRKWEAEVVKAQEVLEKHTTSKDHAIDIYDEEKVIAEGILDLEDWDNEELIRGYRRNRKGDFGPSPKYIPREIQQEAFRRLVTRGNRKLRSAYMQTIEVLIDLAHNGDSEKVKLEATKELLNRVVGKVPDIVVGAQLEQPWESILGDSLIPFGEGDPIEMERGSDGVARMEPIIVDAEIVEDVVKNKKTAAARKKRRQSDPGALSADDEPGSGTGSPTSSVARASGSSSKPRRQTTKKKVKDV